VGLVGGGIHAGAGTRGRRLRDRARTSRGQSLVEFALILPLFLLLVFAVVEYSLINSAIGAYNFAAKDAARQGAIDGPTVATADQDMLKIINGHVIGVVAAVPVEADIFEATESGSYPGTGAQDVYTYSGGAWTLVSANWQPGTLCPTPPCRDDRLVSQDYLGVRITYHYTYVTAFFSSAGATITLTATSVQRIEPQELRHHSAPGTSPVIAARALATPGSPLGGALSLLAIAPALLYRPRRDGWIVYARSRFTPYAHPCGSSGREQR
jgi:Flp pilus assembly protein TadG